MKKLKLLSLLLALVMALCVFMTGCDKDKKDDEGSKEPTTAEGVDPNLSLGIVDGYTYTNKYMGIGLTLDETWELTDAKQLQTLPDSVQDAMNGTLIGEAMKNVTYYMDMQATSTNGTNIITINVVMQKLTAAQKAQYKNMNDEQVIDMTLLGKDALIQSYEAIGMSDITFEKVQVQYLGETRTALKTNSTLYGMPYSIIQVMEYDLGEFTGAVTAACMGEDTCAELLAMFEKI